MIDQLTLNSIFAFSVMIFIALAYVGPSIIYWAGLFWFWRKRKGKINKVLLAVLLVIGLLIVGYTLHIGYTYTTSGD